MKDILKLRASELAGVTFACDCGKHHSVDIRKIFIGKEISAQIIDIAADYKSKDIFVMTDHNTFEAYGKKVDSLLKENNFKHKTFTFKTTLPLVPNEKAMGRLLMEVPVDTGLIIAVGSGTLNDMARFLSLKTGVPYIIVCTAPSMDGYASVGSPLIVEGKKKTFQAVYPLAILADIDVLKKAPIEMIHAGFGDIIGKYTALTDWMLSKELNDEYYCQTSVSLVQNAIEKCVDSMDRISKRDDAAIENIFEALIMSGIAIGLVGNSRPASGAEHHLSHYWEMDAIAKKQEHPLHGNQVGVGAVVISTLYEMLRDKIPQSCILPKPEDIAKMLTTIGGCDNPRDLGIDRELFRNSLIHARKLRPRYTILQYTSDQGLLEELANTLTEKFYG